MEGACLVFMKWMDTRQATTNTSFVELAGYSPQSIWACACAHYHNQRATKNRAKCKRCLQVDNRRAPWKVSACSKGVFPCCCCLPDKCSWGHINKVWCWLEVCGEWCLRIRSLPALMDHLLHNKDKFSFTGGPVSAWTLSGCSRLMDGACLPPLPLGVIQQVSGRVTAWINELIWWRQQGFKDRHKHTGSWWPSVTSSKQRKNTPLPPLSQQILTAFLSVLLAADFNPSPVCRLAN